MGHDKLRKFAENETFRCLVQPSSRELLSEGYSNIKDHPLKGKWPEFFGDLSGNAPDSSRPLVLELGCGKGEYTIELATRNPGTDYIGVDIKGARLWKGAGYAQRNGMPNVGFLRTRIEFINAFFAEAEVSQIWLTFSDPQMKSENSRLTSPVFLEKYRFLLKPGGTVHLKTDSRFLHEYTLAVCKANALKVLACTTDLYGAAAPDTAIEPEVFEVQTFYEKMFLEQGCPITYLSFVIDHEGDFLYPDGSFDAKYWREAEITRRSFGHKSSKGQ